MLDGTLYNEVFVNSKKQGFQTDLRRYFPLEIFMFIVMNARDNNAGYNSL